MNSSTVALINQTNGGAVPPATLQQYAAALQYQVDNHFAPAWNVHADVSVLDAGAVIPPGTLPLNIVDSLAGQAGVHNNYQGQVSAEAVNSDQLSITLSHELLEMLVDPSGTRVTQGADLDPYSGGQ
jgi:hypothetical protein